MHPPVPAGPTSLVEHCRALAEHRAGETAYVWLRDGEEEELRWTFARLDERARAIGAELAARGLAGDQGLLLFTPGLEFVAAFLGCLYAGVVAVPLSPPRGAAGDATVLGIARHAEPRVLLTDDGMHAPATRLAAELGGLATLVTDGLGVPRDDWMPAAVDPASVAFLQYTSGSTGTPKGVEVTHANLMANEEMIRVGFGHDASTVFVSWLPLFHDMGLVGNVLQPLYLGVKSVLMAPAAFVQKPVRWLRAMTRHGGTTTGGPNFSFDLCVERVRDEQLAELDLGACRVIYNGSEPIRAETLERFAERFAPVGLRPGAIYPCYGMAEASLFVTGGPPGRPFVVREVDAAGLEEDAVRPPADGAAHRRLVSCGRPWLDQRVLIVDPATRVELADGAIGEIWVQGRNVARGYRNLPPEVEDPFRATLAGGEGPFLRTGDLGFRAAEEVFVTGRRKDVLIQNGRNYYPQDVELAAAASHRFLRVDGAVAFGVDVDGRERLVVVQEVDRRQGRPLEAGGPAGEALRDELVGAVRSAVSREFGLSTWHVVLVRHASVPRTSSGKVRRRKCRELWARGELLELRAASGDPVARP